ncbi:MAG TPA: alanine racemase [Ktedonobacterales bacterium]|nr:alanine racemase [Ktedonobacterales bacterium]
MILLDDLVRATGGDVLSVGARASCAGFAHDSRRVAPGDCFVAVRGARVDGHDFLREVAAGGAGAVLIEARFRQSLAPEDWQSLAGALGESGVTIIAVEETRAAVKRYARAVLAAWRPLVVAVTGSTGKTTTKEAIADVLALRAPTFRSWRNYNDLLGLPLALGSLEPQHRYAVLEMGCDHPGEIQELCEIAQPTVGVVTNVSATQLQYFGSVGGLAAELTQLPRALPGDGYAVLNAGDPATFAMGSDTGAKVLLFGPLAAGAKPGDTDPRHTVRYRLQRPAKGSTPVLALAALDAPRSVTRFAHLHGDHWATAVLAAATVGEALGVPAAEALTALADLRPLPGRLNLLAGRAGMAVLDDSHNAAPASVAAGLEVLAALGASLEDAAPRIAVLGDMLRLGGEEEAAHRAAGRQAARAASHLVTLGTRAELIASAARRAGLPAGRIAVTRTAEDAARAVLAFAASAHQSAVLVKASEEVRAERVTAQLLAQPERAAELLDRQTPERQRAITMRPDRPTWLEVDLSAIGGNTRQVKARVGERVKVLVSLKADAYGHGALGVARTVLRNGADWLGVATVSEAAPVRAAGVGAPILIFGYTAPWQAREAIRLDLRATVYELESARALAQGAADLRSVARVHVKVDTGMGRLGLRAERVDDVVAFVRALRDLPSVEVEGLFTQIATADSADPTYALRQLARFEAVLGALGAAGLRPPLVHAANSAAIFAFPQAHYDMVRPGIAIYGLPPSGEVPLPPGFRPALAFKTQVAQVKDVPAGEGISYGATYVTTAPARVATLPVGYADGFRRGPRNWGEVLIRGQRAPLLGRVTMDQCMVDVTQIPLARIGDEVVLIGRQGDDELTAAAVAARLGTIHYEVVAALLARVPRVS